MADPARALAEIPVDHEQLFGEAAQRLSRLVGDLCVIAMLGERPGRFEPVAVRHRSSSTRRLVEKALAAADLDPETWPLARRAVQTGEPVLIDDVPSGSLLEVVNPVLRPYFGEHSVSSLLFVPIRARGRTIGLAGLAREGAERSYTSDDQSVVQAVADQVALTLDNARLVGLLRRQGELDAALLAAQSDLGEGVAVLDLETRRLAHVNEAFVEMTGYAEDELEALSFFMDLLPVEDVPVREQELRERRSAGTRTDPDGAVLVRKDGTRIEVEVSIKPLDGDRGDRVVALVREVTDRNRSERKVGLQADVLDQVDAAVKRWAPDGTVVHWNRGAERLYGYSAEETLGRPLRDLIWPQGGDERAAELRREVTERGEFEGELALRRKDGSTFTAYSRIVGVRNSEGGLDGFVGIAVDATERRRAREELEHSRERFRAQYKSLPIPTYTWRREGEDFVLVDFNDAAYRFTEGHIADLLGAHASELHGHDPKILAELREALVATGSLSREIDFPMPSIGQTRRLAMTYVHVPPNVVMVHAEDVTARRRTEVRLRFQAELLDRVDAAVVALDTEGTITHWNRCAQEFYGFSEAEAVGASISDLVARVDVEDREALLERIGTGEGPWEVEFKLRRADGEVIPVYARNATVRGSGGEIIGYVGVSVDISERQRVQEKLRQAEVRYRTLVERLPAITFVAGFGEASWVYVSPQVESMLGYTPEEWEADPALWRSRLHAEDRDRVLAETARAEASGGAIEIEYRIMAKSGDVRWVRHEALVHAGTDGDPGQTEGLLTDITERKAFESQLQFLADHDGLTGLFNRRRFLEELGQEVRLAERQREPGCVLMIDIDNFKYINDSLGHQAGDSLIRSVAGILERRLRGGDTLSRLGGDEFAVLLHGTRSDRAVTVAEGLLEALRERVHLLSGEPVHITASVGIAELEPSAAAEGALAAADLAMYEAKRAGRDRLAVFSPDMHARAEEGRSWAEEIRTALDRDRFQLYCQPIVDLRTGAVAQHELLLRMRGRGDELVPPASFLPMAERFDLVQAIDRWVVGQAVGLIGERRRGGSPIRVAVNLSGRSMGDPALTSHLRKELDRGPAEADDLVLEVAETAATANMEQARSFAERVARLGCRLSLDNFGSGFSSFYYLKYLPVNYLKIDGEFVRKLGTGRIDQEVVRSIVRLAGSVDTRTIAEFVGDQPTYELLSDYGVDYAQGFHVGAPRPVAAI